MCILVETFCGARDRVPEIRRYKRRYKRVALTMNVSPHTLAFVQHIIVDEGIQETTAYVDKQGKQRQV